MQAVGSSLTENAFGGGEYTFYNESTGCYLAWQGHTLRLRKTPCRWTLQPLDKSRYNICARDTGLLLDIHNAYVAVGTPVKVWQRTGYDVQIWCLGWNPNGSICVLYSGDKRYCLGFADGHAQLQLRDKNNPMQEWKVVYAGKTVPKAYFEVVGMQGIVSLQLPEKVLGVITRPRLQQWADDLEKAYMSYYELTGFLPFSNIVIEAYKTGAYFGWVFPNSNIIHINSDYICDELKKMATRRNDWNFCALHEMGHMFDFDKPWNFEAELMTDLKLAYVLEKNNASAAPAQFDASVVFSGRHIIKAYSALGADFSDTYRIFGVAKRFLEIKEDIGWEPFRQTFRYLQLHETAFVTYTCVERFSLFVQLLSRYSNKDVKNCFSQEEWNTVSAYCGNGHG